MNWNKEKGIELTTMQKVHAMLDEKNHKIVFEGTKTIVIDHLTWHDSSSAGMSVVHAMDYLCMRAIMIRHPIVYVLARFV